MPSWNEIQNEINRIPSAHDIVRRGYLQQLAKMTGRNVIAYYSGWLQHPENQQTSITDADKDGFMNAVYKMDKTKGLDLLLHTPGGNLAATESIGQYLKDMFHDDIRCFVPQLAMSGGTMLACCGKTIVMGKESSIGPIDPQFNGIPVHGVLKEFEEAIKAVSKNPKSLPIWQVIISKYHPSFIGECRNAMQLSTEIVTKWLKSGMFAGNSNATKTIKKIISSLNDHSKTKIHARHIPAAEALAMGLKVEMLEKKGNEKLQDIVLSVHHAYMSLFWTYPCIKVIESDQGQVIMINQGKQP
jgi:hypothetical protein